MAESAVVSAVPWPEHALRVIKKGMAGQKWGPDVMAHPAEEFSESSERGKFCQHAWRAYWQCGGVLPEGDLNPSEAYGENIMDLQSISLPHGQRNFAGHPDKCPAEALPRNKALGGISGTLGSSRCCYGEQAKTWCFRAALHYGGRPSPHQETEAWPQHGTRNARVPIPAKAGLSRNFAA